MGAVNPVTLQDLHLARSGGLGECRRVVGDLHCRLSIRACRNWLREDPLVRPYKWLRPDMVLSAPFLQCELHLTHGGSGVLADPAGTDEEFQKAWLPHVCRSGQREASPEEFNDEFAGWLLVTPCAPVQIRMDMAPL